MFRTESGKLRQNENMSGRVLTPVLIIIGTFAWLTAHYFRAYTHPVPILISGMKSKYKDASPRKFNNERSAGNE
jgi:hypothetical protein